jgi:putative mRNA 3-end processing factor
MHIPCNSLRIGLDHPDGDLSFLSHAHSDHTSGLKRQKRILASPETLELAGFAPEPASCPGAKLLDAGHILGSRQLLVDSDSRRTAYTGDFSLRPNVFGWKAEIPQCDRLIMEATYGDPSYVFPAHEEVHGMISRWVRGNESSNLVIGCYELGKAQEMIRILNENGVAPLITEKAEAFTSVYGKYGVKLDRIVVGSSEAEEAMGHRFVSLLPMAKAKRYFASRLAQAFERETLCAVATGWALHHRFDADAAFPLSDHADFNDLVEFAAQSGAKDVEFFCGDGSRVLAARKQAILNS